MAKAKFERNKPHIFSDMEVFSNLINVMIKDSAYCCFLSALIWAWTVQRCSILDRWACVYFSFQWQ